MMTNQNGQPISDEPKYLLAPATQETTAQKGIAAIYPTQTNYVNVFEDFVRLVVDARLDHLGQTLPWYLFADVATALPTDHAATVIQLAQHLGAVDIRSACKAHARVNARSLVAGQVAELQHR
jgi:hypothetical protein